MSYQRSSPLGETSSTGQPRAGGAAGGNTVVTVTKGATTQHVTAAGTVVTDYRGTQHVVDQGSAVNYGNVVTRENRQSQDPAYLEQQAALEQQNAEALQVESRKKYITIGAVAIAAGAVLLILRRKKGTSS